MAKDAEMDPKALSAYENKMKEFDKSFKKLGGLISKKGTDPQVILKQKVNCEILMKAAEKLVKKL